MENSQELKFEHRAVIKFLTLEGSKPAEIQSRMAGVYAGAAPSYATIKRWAAEFKRGRDSLEDDPRCGRPRTVVTADNIQRIQALVDGDRRMKVRELAADTGLSDPQVIEILHQHLHLSKVSARWIPRILTSDQKSTRVQYAKLVLRTYDPDPASFLSCCVTGDETWIHHHDPESKQESKQWLPVGSPAPLKARTACSAGKIMLTVFWDAKGPLLLDFLPHKQTVTGAYYADLIARLREAIKENRRGMLSRGVVLLHDNAPAHTSSIAKAAVSVAGFRKLLHPAYSPDLAPSDFHLFPHLKRALRGQRFDTDEALMDAATAWFEGCSMQFFQSGIEALRSRCHKCILVKGDYEEKAS